MVLVDRSQLRCQLPQPKPIQTNGIRPYAGRPIADEQVALHPMISAAIEENSRAAVTVMLLVDLRLPEHVVGDGETGLGPVNIDGRVATVVLRVSE